MTEQKYESENAPGKDCGIVSFPEGQMCFPARKDRGDTTSPPYINRSTAPRSSYQTVFARKDGSVPLQQQAFILRMLSSKTSGRKRKKDGLHGPPCMGLEHSDR